MSSERRGDTWIIAYQGPFFFLFIAAFGIYFIWCVHSNLLIISYNIIDTACIWVQVGKTDWSPQSLSSLPIKFNASMCEGTNSVLDESSLLLTIPHLLCIWMHPTTKLMVCKSVTTCVVVCLYVVIFFFAASLPMVTQGVITVRSAVVPQIFPPQNLSSGILNLRMSSSFP